MLNRRIEPVPGRSHSGGRIASALLAALLAFGALLGIAAPAQAAPAAPDVEVKIPNRMTPVSVLENPSPGTYINTATVVSGEALVMPVGPGTLFVTPTGAFSYPNAQNEVKIQYRVNDGTETSSGLVTVHVLREPWLLPSGPATATVEPGASAEFEVTALTPNALPAQGAFSVKGAGPAVGTVRVTDSGHITYTAPENAAPGTYTFNIVGTDTFGQTGELFQPYAVTVLGTARADTFDVDIPYASTPLGTRVDILPDHARGENVRVTDVTANINNAAVVFDGTGATFTPPAGHVWGPEQNGYTFAAPYTVTDDNGTANGQINVRVLRQPLLSVDTPTQAVAVGRTATATVSAMNYPVIPANGGYRVEIPPSAGTASVDDRGRVVFDATGATAGETYWTRIEVTDKVGQSQTIDVAFEVYEGAYAPDSHATAADAPVTLDLLAGAEGEGKRLSAAVITSGDATVVPDLAAGSAVVRPDHAWAEGESAHELVLSYTVADARGGTDTGAVTIRVLRAPVLSSPHASAEVGMGGTVELRVNALNAATIDRYDVSEPPAQGRATVSSSGEVLFDADGADAGDYTFTVRATDVLGQATELDYAVGVLAAPVFAHSGSGDTRKHVSLGEHAEFSAAVLEPGNLPDSDAYIVTKQPELVAVASSSVAAASGGSPVSVDASGRVVFDSTGLVAGGEYAFTVTVTDRVGQSASLGYRVSIESGAPDDSAARADGNGGADGSGGGAGGNGPGGSGDASTGGAKPGSSDALATTGSGASPFLAYSIALLMAGAIALGWAKRRRG